MQRARKALLALVLLCASCNTTLTLAYEPGQVLESEGSVVVCEDEIASRIGAAVLREGGNAVDAAVATAFALSVTFPQAGGPGGGGFAVVAMPGKAPDALDFRETAPAAATADMFLDADGKPDRKRSLRSRLGAGIGAGTPGTPAGLWALHQRHGRLPWKRLVDPAVALARDGFEVPEGLAAALNEAIWRDPSARAVFVLGDRPWRAGDRLVQPYLARTLQAIRDRGSAGFYEGPVAALLVADMTSATTAPCGGRRPVSPSAKARSSRCRFPRAAAWSFPRSSACSSGPAALAGPPSRSNGCISSRRHPGAPSPTATPASETPPACPRGSSKGS